MKERRCSVTSPFTRLSPGLRSTRPLLASTPTLVALHTTSDAHIRQSCVSSAHVLQPTSLPPNPRPYLPASLGGEVLLHTSKKDGLDSARISVQLW